MTSVSVTWAAAAKWAVRERGDAVAAVESHRSAVCGLIVDVQGSGDGAGSLAWSLVSLGSQLAAEGCEAESIAAMLNRALWTRRRGRVQAGVGVIVVQPPAMATVARYGSVLLLHERSPDRPDEAGSPPAAGIDRDGVPWAARWSLDDGAIVMCSDGIAETAVQLRALLALDPDRPRQASQLLEHAVARDEGRPRNDMSVIVAARSPADPQPALAAAGALTVIDRSLPSAAENRRV